MLTVSDCLDWYHVVLVAYSLLPQGGAKRRPTAAKSNDSNYKFHASFLMLANSIIFIIYREFGLAYYVGVFP